MIRCQTCGQFAESLWAGECHPCFEKTADRMFWDTVPVMDASVHAVRVAIDSEVIR